MSCAFKYLANSPPGDNSAYVMCAQLGPLAELKKTMDGVSVDKVKETGSG